jgi:hypothetical protein
MFGLVNSKVQEAEYFLDRILTAQWNFFGVQCDTVAFTASARSEDTCWQLLRREADGCNIQSQFQEWLGKRVPHPDDEPWRHKPNPRHDSVVRELVIELRFTFLAMGARLMGSASSTFKDAILTKLHWADAALHSPSSRTVQTTASAFRIWILLSE